MYQIQNITNAPKQKQTLVLPDGKQIVLNIYFSSLQLGWFIHSITYGSFVLNGARIVNSPNMLHQFRNKIPFGLACFSTGNREPSLIDDFLSGASKLYILDEDEITYFTGVLSGEIQS